MDLFILDTLGNEELLQQSYETKNKKYYTGETQKTKTDAIEEDDLDSEEDDGDYGGLPPPSKDLSHIINRSFTTINNPLKKSKDKETIDSYIESMGWNNTKNNPSTKTRFQFPELNTVTGKIDDDLDETDVRKEIESSTIKGIESKTQLYNPSERKLKLLNKKERSKTKGDEWFNMPATEITEEIENDLKILQMRSALDPKHFYKKNDLKVLPKYFQIGTVQHSPLDYYSEKHIRKNKKKTIVDELMADAEFKQYTKRKYKEIMEKKQQKGFHKAMKKMKKLKKKK